MVHYVIQLELKEPELSSISRDLAEQTGKITETSFFS